MLFQILLALELSVVFIISQDQRQAELIILPPIILGYDELYDENKGKVLSQHSKERYIDHHSENGHKNHSEESHNNHNSKENHKLDGLDDGGKHLSSKHSKSCRG